jgi:hypothetical protein
VLATLLERLADCPDLTLDGEPVRASTEPVGPVAFLDEDGDGFRLALAPDPEVREVFDDVVAHCGDALRPVAPRRLTGRETEELGRGRHFGPGEVAALVTEVLPSLRERIAVVVRATGLPRTVEAAARIRLEVRREDEGLSVLPTLVYGDPPLARVDAGRLVLLSGAVPLRDEQAERELVRRLARELELAPGHRMLLRGDAAVSFAERLARFRGELVGDALEGFRRADPLVPRLEIQGADFALRFESALDGAPKSAAAERVLRAWRNGESLVALDGGGFAPLPADWLALHGERIADLLAARSAARSGSLPRCALPDLARLCDEIGEPRPAEADALRRRLEQRGGASGPELPGDLRATLRRYQREGVAWLGLLRDAELGALLADDMGLGKTLQALCALRGRTLVVAPTSVLHNWRDEIARFRPGLRCSLYHGPGRRLSPRADVTLTSYAILRLDAESLAAQRWDSVILDEAQIIKNPDSQVARAAYRLQAAWRLALTGTPVENRLDELWSQLHFLNPGLLGTRRDFDERVGRPVAAGDEPAVARLRERTRPFLLRRLKRDVAPELPPRTDIVLHAVLDEEERHTYEAIRAATRRDVVERLAAGSGVLQALEALLRLRQAACHRALVPGQRAASSSKLELLLEMLDEVVAEGHKALVFSQWTKLLDLVEPRLGESGLPFARLDGSTRDRAGVVARFQDEAGPPVMLVSLTAGGLGLNLTAADHVFILDPWWNPAVEDQAADRAHRIGQDRPVMVYRLVAEQTVEERVLALQQRKREIAEAAVGAGGRAGAITRHELLELLA